jgi:chemotaxis protein MotB
MVKDKDDSGAPVTIIRKRRGGAHDGHHGGAWKIAYADFVTAMMAFFLLMWLLSAIPTEKLTGIAQYFEPTVGIRDSKGIGFEGGTARQTEGSKSATEQQGLIYGVMRKGEIVDTPERGNEITTEEADNQRFSLIEEEINKTIVNDSGLRQFQDSILIKQTPEGLVITIADQDKYPMFAPGKAELNTYTQNILSKIAELIRYSPNFIAISGHTDKNSERQSNYTNWELSADRANATRRFMVDEGIATEQIARVVAHADTDPLLPNDVNSPRNRRIEIILLRNSLMPFHKVAAPKELLDTSMLNGGDDLG